MKKNLLTSALALFGFLFSNSMSAQESLAADQNPNYKISRDKYMLVSDSINQWHSTTIQQTYKAYDWYEAKMERKRDRLQFRRELRLERARHHYYGSWNRPYHYDRFNSPFRYRNNFWGYWW